jgi:calcineurin-like phosphoesterase family protein
VYKLRPEHVRTLERLHGNIILLRGNHDVFADEVYAPYVHDILPEGKGLEVRVAGLDCWLVHYPTLARADRFNLVGHVHGLWQVQKNSLNVGVDAHSLRPLHEETVRDFYRGIVERFDDDVWAGDLDANTAHQERGLTGSYFRP